MNKTGVYQQDEIAKANKMSRFNLYAECGSAEDIVFTSAAYEAGEVTGTASATLTTIVMNMFGFGDFALSVDCSAELHLSSADIMFVLDTTGSMNCDPGVVCGSSTELANAKINGLREAVKDFYKTVAAAVNDKDETRIRFGFVPYSMTVNVKPLVTSGVIAPDYLTSTTPYQTRLAHFNTAPPNPTAQAPVVETQTYTPAQITQTQCNNYGINRFPSTSGVNPVAGGGPPPTAATSTTYSYRSWTRTSGSGSSALGTCVRNRTVTTSTYVTVYRLSGFRYIKANLDTSAFKGTGTIQLASSISSTATVPITGYYNLQTLAATTGRTGISNTSYLWCGCIEVRGTVIDLAMDPVPDEATDLDINSAPSSELTKWRPSFAAPVYRRGTNSVSVDTGTAPPGSYSQQIEYCPSPLRVLEEVDHIPTCGDPDL